MLKDAVHSSPPERARSEVELEFPCYSTTRSVASTAVGLLVEDADGYDFVEHWVKDSCNHDLATLTVYTEGRTPQETCAEIERQLQPPSVQRMGR